MTNFFRLKSSDSDYHRLFRRNSIEHFKVYAGDHSLIGDAADTWVDDAGRYYLVVDRNAEHQDDQILVPIDQFHIDSDRRQIHIEMDAAQITSLPIVTAEGIVRGTGQMATSQMANQTIGTPIAAHPAGVNSASVVDTAAVRTYAPLEASSPLESSAPLDVPHQHKDVQRVVMPETMVSSPARIQEPIEQTKIEQTKIEQPTIAPAPAAEVLVSPVQPAAGTSARTAQEEKIRLLEERLVVNARKQKIGEVIVRKEVITEMVQVPIRREKLIVEQISPEHRQIVEVDLSQGDRSAIELIESLNAGSMTGSAQPGHSSVTSGSEQGSSLSIQAASRLLTELAARPEYQNAAVRIEFADPGLQAEYLRRSR